MPLPPMECRVCGCTEFDPCVDEETGETCGWVLPVANPENFQEARPICSFCYELQEMVRDADGQRVPFADEDEPLVQLATEADLNQIIRERR